MKLKKVREQRKELALARVQQSRKALQGARDEIEEARAAIKRLQDKLESDGQHYMQKRSPNLSPAARLRAFVDEINSLHSAVEDEKKRLQQTEGSLDDLVEEVNESRCELLTISKATERLTAMSDKLRRRDLVAQENAFEEEVGDLVSGFARANNVT